MLEGQRITGLDEDSRNFISDSKEREEFIHSLSSHDGPGWALIRVSPGSALAAKYILESKGIIRENIHIIGANLAEVPIEELININAFKRRYADTEMFAQVHVAITVASCRAGINFGQNMKEKLISTWDNTYSSVAAVVQANVGRACGYHDNRDPIHYTNISSLKAYGMILDHLENSEEHDEATDFEGLREVFRTVCQEYNVNGLDVGLTVNNRRRRPVGDVQTYWTDSYLVVPGKLRNPSFDFGDYTEDEVLLDAIDLIREEYFKKSWPKSKR